MDRYPDRWGDGPDPAWMHEPTGEWRPAFPGQRYPGDVGSPGQAAPRRGRPTAAGRAGVHPGGSTGSHPGRAAGPTGAAQVTRPAGQQPAVRPQSPAQQRGAPVDGRAAINRQPTADDWFKSTSTGPGPDARSPQWGAPPGAPAPAGRNVPYHPDHPGGPPRDQRSAEGVPGTGRPGPFPPGYAAPGPFPPGHPAHDRPPAGHRDHRGRIAGPDRGPVGPPDQVWSAGSSTAVPGADRRDPIHAEPRDRPDPSHPEPRAAQPPARGTPVSGPPSTGLRLEFRPAPPPSGGGGEAGPVAAEQAASGPSVATQVGPAGSAPSGSDGAPAAPADRPVSVPEAHTVADRSASDPDRAGDTLQQRQPEPPDETGRGTALGPIDPSRPAVDGEETAVRPDAGEARQMPAEPLTPGSPVTVAGGGPGEPGGTPDGPEADPSHPLPAGTAGRDGGQPPGDPAATADRPVTDGPDSARAGEPDADAVGASPATAQASPDTVRPLPAGVAAGAATALRAPTMLTPTVQPAPPATASTAEPSSGVPAAATDPEQVLASYHWRFHPETLRELVEDPDELRAVRDRLTERVDAATENAARARLLSLRAVVSRILGDLGKALADGKLALAHAEATGELRRIAIAQARLAHVLQWRGDFAEADRLFAEANSSELPDRLRATMHEHAGRSCYDQGRYMEACNHFEKALELRKVEDPDLIARTELALDAVFAKVAQNGWGPYPRTPEEILQSHRAPSPLFSEELQRWGYAGPDGELAVPPAYADVQPFRDGVAWVRRPEVRNWELIDESGTTLIEASVGYPGVSSFADGLAWVSRDGTGGWIAIDKGNRVLIPNGFEDVRPFRRGVAAVRRGGWGAVDRTGQLVLPTRYDGFVTALTDGRYVEGFTDEGLAIVNAGGRKGVFDRTGRMLVRLVHPALVIHPVAFLIGNGTGQWGALDRRGEPLIDLVHPSRADVMDEIDRLLADTTPVL